MKKKIAYILSRFPTVSETFILYEIVELMKLGLEIDVFPLIHQGETVLHPEVKLVAPHVHYHRYISWKAFKDHIFWLLKKPGVYLQTMIGAIFHNLRSWKFLTRAIGVLLLSAQVARTMEELGIQHIHAHAATHPTLLAYIVSQLTGLPYSFTAHSSDIYFNQTMLCEKIRRACFVVTISKYNVGFLQEVCPTVAQEKITVIHCGIDPEKFKAQPIKETDGRVKIICVGRLEPIKGHQYLIEACAQLKSEQWNFQCDLVGDGEMQSQIQQEIKRLDLAQHVNMLGFQTHDKVVEMLKQSDILVLPSISEGIPVAVMEGMASSLPIVATEVTGVPELVEEGVTGFLVPSRNGPALAEALQKLLESPHLRARMGEAGRQKVINEFELHRSAKELFNAFTND